MISEADGGSTGALDDLVAIVYSAIIPTYYTTVILGITADGMDGYGIGDMTVL